MELTIGLLHLAAVGAFAVLLQKGRRYSVPWGVAGVVAGLLLWYYREPVEGPTDSRDVAREHVGPRQKAVYSLLIALQLQEEAAPLLDYGIDTLELVVKATPADAAQAGVKAGHWRHIVRAAKVQLQMKDPTTPSPSQTAVEDPLATLQAPVPTYPGGRRAFVMRPYSTGSAQADFEKKEEVRMKREQARVERASIFSSSSSSRLASIYDTTAVRKPPPPPPPPSEEKKPTPPPTPRPPTPPPTPMPPTTDDLQSIIGAVGMPKKLRRLTVPAAAKPKPPESLRNPGKTGKIVLLEAAVDGQDFISCTMDGRYSSLGGEVEAGVTVLRFENVDEAKAASPNGKFVLYLKDPITRAAGVFKRHPPDCLYPGQAAPARRNPLETYVEADADRKAACEEHNNRLVKALTGHPMDVPVTGEHFRKALEMIEKHVEAIIVLEQVEESMRVLNQMAEIKTFVQCAPHIQSQRRTLSEELLKAFMQDNELDWNLYIQAGRLFDADVARLKPSEADCVKLNQCWDGTQEPENQKRVEREQVPDLIAPCKEAGCIPTRGRDVMCGIRKCTLKEKKS